MDKRGITSRVGVVEMGMANSYDACPICRNLVKIQADSDWPVEYKGKQVCTKCIPELRAAVKAQRAAHSDGRAQQ